MKIVITNDSLMYNRGSEAVIRSVAFICRRTYPDSEIVVSSGREGEVLKNVYDANKIVPKFDSIGGLSYLLEEIQDADDILVTGADNYDYGFDNLHMIKMNDEIFANVPISSKVVLFDCSLREDHFSDVVKKDFSRFSIITTREKRTYKLLKDYFGDKKVLYYPDPAFVLPIEECSLPFGFEPGNTVGINISNLIMGNRVGAPQDIVIANYKKVIEYLLENTNYKILIIQHVFNNGYDLDAANLLYKGYEYESRVSILQSELLNSMNIKYIISKLNVLITARTHASIAAYSTNVPTYVVGYSVKSEGIAEDIFGEKDKYVIQVRDLTNEDDLLNGFLNILNESCEIREMLKKRMDQYKKSAMQFGEIL